MCVTEFKIRCAYAFNLHHPLHTMSAIKLQLPFSDYNCCTMIVTLKAPASNIQKIKLIQ